MVLSAIVMELAFRTLYAVPARADVCATVTHFSLDDTFWLNLISGALAIWLFTLAKPHPHRPHELSDSTFTTLDRPAQPESPLTANGSSS